MDLHFCSQCGISIPQSEVDSGSATGADGKFFCSEHRGGAAVAVAEAERPSDRTAFADASGAGLDPELLFCANCRVSIPLSDVKSGRAHREFGSLLCAGCTKADPGERAARREAVEAEMAADVDAQDPVVARRCSVCSAAVPYGQIVTGKAKVEGDRVVCERCRAAAVAVPAPDAGDGWPSGVVLFLVLVAACGIGYFATQMWRERNDAKKPQPEEPALRTETNVRLTKLEASLADMEGKAGATDERLAAESARVDADLAAFRKMMADLRTDLSKSDVDMSERVAKIEGQLASMSAMMSGLASHASQPPVPPVTDKPPPAAGPTPPPANEPPKKDGPAAPPAVNPEVAKLCKDLLESPATEVRYAAAQGLTTIKDPASIPSLVKALGDDKHYFVRRGCARALSVMKAWFAVPALIKALEDPEVYVALMANTAIQNITGNDFGVTQETPAGQRRQKAAAAEKWWEKNKDKPPDGVSLHPITE